MTIRDDYRFEYLPDKQKWAIYKNNILHKTVVNRNQALDFLFSLRMDEYPQALLADLYHAGNRFGMSGGVITDVAMQYLEAIESGERKE